jgi:flagellin
MGLRISTNVAAIGAQRQLGIQQKRTEHSIAALSSGSRIQSAADDSAGLAISEGLRSQTRGLAQATSNANNAMSLLQTSEGGLNEIDNILIRVRELGIQSASDTVSDKERDYIHSEATQLISEADRIAKTTRFGDNNLLDGSGKDLEFQVGAQSGENNIIKFKSGADATSHGLGSSDIDLSSKDSARDSLETVDEALDKVSKMRSDFGSLQSRLNSTTASLGSQFENLSAANSRLRDTDVAHESTELASAKILEESGIAVMAQANQSPAAALRLIAG